MSHADVSARMTKCLLRHNDLCLELIEEMRQTENAVESGDMEGLNRRQEEYLKRIRVLQAEFEALSSEWRQQPVEPHRREAVLALAREAEALSEQVVTAREQAVEQLQARMNEIRASLSGAHRGMDALRHYRAGDYGDAGHLDRRA